MISSRWKTGCIGIAIIIAICSLALGGLWEVIIPGSVVLATMMIVWRDRDIDLFILAVGQLVVYGASYGSYFAAVICEVSLFVAILGNAHTKLLIAAFITLSVLGVATQFIYHTGWWIVGLAILCTILIVSGYTRKEALSRSMRDNSNE